MAKKIFFIFLLLAISYQLLATRAYAKDPNFDISVDADYKVKESGVTEITQTIGILNKSDFYFTPSYTVSVGFKNIENIQASNSDGSIPTTIDDTNPENKSIKLVFPKRYAGANTTNKFTLKFTTKDIAVRQGSVWELTIPGIKTPEDFSSYNTQISVPESFGKPSILKPARNVENNGSIKLKKSDVGKSGIYILYGEKQYYKFSLKYNISNPNLFPVRTEVALPPQTNYQNVLISGFSENPINVTRDQDNNWIAEYRLLPQQKKTVTVSGFVEILESADKEKLTEKQKNEYIKPKKFWNSDDASVIQSAKSLSTPQDIYEFTVKKLSYNHSKISANNTRLGAIGALSDSKNSVCLEFTDLFIALARARGIPARAVEGFAYTQNSKLRPLSLVSDILHAWPEYYDSKQEKWLMVDPTWGNTTKGMDYFTSLDFSHVAFVIKGYDSEYPIPAGGYKFNKDTKDITVSFASKDEFKKIKKLAISDTFPTSSFPKIDLQGTFLLENKGNTPLSDITANVKTNKGTKRQFLVDYIPPGGSRKITTSFSDVPFLTNKKYIITIEAEGQSYSKKVGISFFPDFRILLLIGGLISGSIIITAITYTSGSLLIQRRKRKNTLRGKS